MNQYIISPYTMVENNLGNTQVKAINAPDFFTNHCIFVNNSAWHSQTNNNILFNFITVAKKLEANRLKLYSGKGVNAHFNREFVQFANLYSGLMQQLSWSKTFKLNPYLQVLLDVHVKLLQENSYFANPSQFYITLYHSLVNALLHNKCGVTAKEYEKPLKAELMIQKKGYKNIIRKHQQVNLLFLEIPCCLGNSVQINLSPQRIEQIFKDSICQLCINLKTHRSLLNKLCPIQWRIVKAYDGSLIAQFQLYIVGEPHDYIQLIQDEWDLTCTEMYLPYNTQLFVAFAKHCYHNNGVTTTEWDELLKRYQAPLSLYRYKANGITFEWNTSGSNI